MILLVHSIRVNRILLYVGPMETIGVLLDLTPKDVSVRNAVNVNCSGHSQKDARLKQRTMIHTLTWKQVRKFREYRVSQK